MNNTLWVIGFLSVAWSLPNSAPAQEENEVPAPGEEPAASSSIPRLNLQDRVTGLSGEQGSTRLYRLTLPPNTRQLAIRLQGGTGDADLYLRHEAPPTRVDFDWRPYVAGNDEEARLRTPEAGDWYLLLYGDSPYAEADLEIQTFYETEPSEREMQSPFDVELAMYYELSNTIHGEKSWSTELRNHALRQEGRTAFDNGDFNQAIEIWSRWAQLDPSNSDPVSLIGDIYLRRGELETAIEYYRRSLSIQPSRVGLVLRLARLLDVETGQPDEARNLLNRYSRLFPNHPDIALGQAKWLLRRNRHDEAHDLIRRIIGANPDNLRARALLHGMLKTPEERFENMQAILAIGEQPSMERILGQAISDNQLLTWPESWILMDFIERMSVEAVNADQRDFFSRLLPRKTVTVEDFRLGRMTNNWISSRDQMWNEEGNFVLSADTEQTEAYLRLVRSDALHNGFIEATIDGARGFFWLYARRGEGNMIRFGFDESGLMYQQVWMKGTLHLNESRLWSKPPGKATLRLEIKADGVYTTVDGRPAFPSPLSIPEEMGLGWWGVAPWAPEPGRAAVHIHRLASGPAPVRIALFPVCSSTPENNLERLQAHISTLSGLAPDGWYRQAENGTVFRHETALNSKIRLLSYYYRLRLMPVVHVQNLQALNWSQLARRAKQDRLTDFILLLNKMPDPDWLAEAERRIPLLDIAVNFLVFEPDERRALFREIAPRIGLFPGGRRPRRLPMVSSERLSALAGDPAAAEGCLVRYPPCPDIP